MTICFNIMFIIDAKLHDIHDTLDDRDRLHTLSQCPVINVVRTTISQ